MELLDSEDYFFFFLEKSPIATHYMKSVKLWMALAQNIVLQSTLTIVMHTNVYELGWCKCETSVDQKMNSDLEKLWPEFEADLSHQLTQKWMLLPTKQ